MYSEDLDNRLSSELSGDLKVLRGGHCFLAPLGRMSLLHNSELPIMGKHIKSQIVFLCAVI